jgi:hypothetical protein
VSGEGRSDLNAPPRLFQQLRSENATLTCARTAFSATHARLLGRLLQAAGLIALPSSQPRRERASLSKSANRRGASAEASAGAAEASNQGSTNLAAPSFIRGGINGPHSDLSPHCSRHGRLECHLAGIPWPSIALRRIEYLPSFEYQQPRNVESDETAGQRSDANVSALAICIGSENAKAKVETASVAGTCDLWRS